MERFRDLVNAVTVDDIQRVSQKYLHPDRLSIVLVGDASVFIKQLPALGFDPVERITVRELDLTATDLRRRGVAGAAPRGGAREAGVGEVQPASFAGVARTAPEPARQAAADLVARAVAAKGGLERLRAIRTIVSRADMTVVEGGGRATFPVTTSIQYPDRFRTDAMTPAGRLVQVFDRGQCWVQNERGVHQAPAALAAELRGHVQRDLVRLLLGIAEGRMTASRAPDVVESGRPMPALEVQAPEMRAVTLVLDPESALVFKQRYITGDDPLAIEETYSDYRDVDGIKVAFRTVLSGAGVPTVERVVRSFRYNVPVDPALFTRPS
jgi:hypothetical protein